MVKKNTKMDGKLENFDALFFKFLEVKANFFDKEKVTTIEELFKKNSKRATVLVFEEACLNRLKSFADENMDDSLKLEMGVHIYTTLMDYIHSTYDNSSLSSSRSRLLKLHMTILNYQQPKKDKKMSAAELKDAKSNIDILLSFTREMFFSGAPEFTGLELLPNMEEQVVKDIFAFILNTQHSLTLAQLGGATAEKNNQQTASSSASSSSASQGMFAHGQNGAEKRSSDESKPAYQPG